MRVIILTCRFRVGFPLRTGQWLFFGALLLLLHGVSPAGADIYKFEDNDVIHFTDTPTDSRFKVYMRDIRKDKRLRTRFR